MDTELETKLIRNGTSTASSPGGAGAESWPAGWAARMVHRFGGRRTVFAATAGCLSTGVWLALFTIGLCIPTQPYRDRLMAMDPTKASAPSTSEVVESLVVVAFAYTPTNLALLCCAASLVGCLGRLATTNDAEAQAAIDEKRGAGPKPPCDTPAEEGAGTGVSPLAPAITAITWGLFIYLIVVSGTVVVTGDPFKSTSPEQYLRLAGSASLLAFAVGWRPQSITQFVNVVCSTKMGGSKGTGR